MTCEQVWAQAMEVFPNVSTKPAEKTLSSQMVRLYTQFCTQLTAAQSTNFQSIFTTVNSLLVHIFHTTYNYNYLYIRKDY